MFTYTKLGSVYQFEIMGVIDPNTPNAYVAGGLSFDSLMVSARELINKTTLIIKLNR